METEKKPQNPSAFPAWDMTFDKNPNTDLFSAGTSYGMSLRDYFAAKAVQGLLSSYTNDGDAYSAISNKSKEMAKDVYKLADAMLKQREL